MEVVWTWKYMATEADSEMMEKATSKFERQYSDDKLVKLFEEKLANKLSEKQKFILENSIVTYARVHSYRYGKDRPTEAAFEVHMILSYVGDAKLHELRFFLTEQEEIPDDPWMWSITTYTVGEYA